MLYFLYFCFFIETKVEKLFETLYMILGFFLKENIFISRKILKHFALIRKNAKKKIALIRKMLK